MQSYRYTQIMNDKQELSRMYTLCMKEHYGKPEEIAKFCEPILSGLNTINKSNSPFANAITVNN